MRRSMACLLAAFALGARGQEAVKPFYTPLPAAEWPGEVPGAARGVVVVAARLADGSHQFGNGLVVRSGTASAPAWVLTCAHVIEREGTRAAELHVGAFAHNRARGAAGEYAESIAAVVSSDAARDLALLSVRGGGALNAWSPSGLDRGGGPLTVASVVPHGRPVVEERFHPTIRRGMSGSPVFDGGELRGLAQGSIAGRMEMLVGWSDIEQLLRGIEGGKELLAGWTERREALERFLDSR